MRKTTLLLFALVAQGAVYRMNTTTIHCYKNGFTTACPMLIEINVPAGGSAAIIAQITGTCATYKART